MDGSVQSNHDVKGYVAKCLLINPDNRILLLKIGEHTKYPYLSHTSDLPGGIVKENETPDEGAQRETREETGIDIPLSELREVYRARTVVAGVGTVVEKRLYLAQVTTSEVNLSYEHQSYRWITLDELLHKKFVGFYFDDFIEEALRRLVDERLIETI